MSAARIAALVAGLLLLAGCSPDNHDPRDGRVVIDDSNCLTGQCYTIYKVCLGPDLVYVDTSLDEHHDRRTLRNDPRCSPSYREAR